MEESSELVHEVMKLIVDGRPHEEVEKKAKHVRVELARRRREDHEYSQFLCSLMAWYERAGSGRK